MGYLDRLLVSIGIISLATALQTPSCSPNSKCPDTAPCCSAYGQCGAGAYCLGGCDIKSSFSIESCMPNPTCVSQEYPLNSDDGLQQNTFYLGDATKVNWVVEGVPTPYADSSLLLTMSQDTSGTLLSSAHYVWYGKISATMKSSAGQGVVSAFIMMSDVKDEIDFEFVGAELQTAQSNFYWQGAKNYTNSMNLTASNTNTDWHTYTIDWQEDSLKWIIDGEVQRTLFKKDTLDPKSGIYKYPQTPSRVQFSLWPAGTDQNAPGTVEWAGGYIDWNSPYMSSGYYHAQIKDVTIQCADPPSGINAAGSKSYRYTDTTGLQENVEITNDNSVLASFYATGLKPDFSLKKDSSSGSGSDKSPSTNVQTVPGGITGAGVRGDGSDPGSGFAPGSAGVGQQVTHFTQGIQGMAAPGLKTKAVQGSAFAALVAFIVFIAF